MSIEPLNLGLHAVTIHEPWALLCYKYSCPQADRAASCHSRLKPIPPRVTSLLLSCGWVKYPLIEVQMNELAL